MGEARRKKTNIEKVGGIILRLLTILVMESSSMAKWKSGHQVRIVDKWLVPDKIWNKFR